MPQSGLRPLASAMTLALVMSACGGDSGGNVIAPDDIAPTVTITEPAPGPVSGSVTIAAEASDNVAVTGVRFLINGVVLGPDDTEAPYQQTWDASQAMGGTVQLTAMARDAAGNEDTSPPVTVSITHGPGGVVQVSVAATGPGEDPDGFTVLVDGAEQGRIGPGTTTTSIEVGLGTHRVELGGVAGWCSVTGDAVVFIPIASGETRSADFALECAPTPQGLILLNGYNQGISRIVQVAPNGDDLQVLVNNANIPAWSPDRSRLAFVKDGDVFIAAGDGSDPHPITTTSQIEEHLRWSPDGTKLLYARPRGEVIGASPDVFVMNADGSGQRPVFATAARRETASWSPDARRIAYAAGPGNQLNIWTANADGTGAAQLTHGGIDISPDWSPDGSRIVYRHADVEGPESQTDIFVIGAGGGAATNLTHSSGGDFEPVWSPDGEWIAFASSHEGSIGVWIMRPDGSLPQSVTGSTFDFVSDPSWR